MGIPILQMAQIGALRAPPEAEGRKRYPLVLMLEPLFRCNLACAGCGKIDYPDPILNQRLPLDECLHAMDECGAPVVVIAGGEPLLHKELPEIVKGAIARRKFVTVCTNALLLEKQIDRFKPNRYFNWSIHLDGDQEMHDQLGLPEGRLRSRRRGNRSSPSRTRLPRHHQLHAVQRCRSRAVASFFDDLEGFGIDGITVSPGYAYERAPDQKHFLNREQDEAIVPRHLQARQWRQEMAVLSSPMLFLDFLAGNRTYECTPWGNPTRTVFGWQRPCYLLGRRLCQDVCRTDGYDRLGYLRRRQIREMRRLHGALRIRGDGRFRSPSPVHGRC